ncbi:hypothetical protein [Clostridium sp. UBA4548]|uniref:hypothetical protein n=1 Tax=Clostridium sp. UBA4548 TaxID=1946361 RepID=UPI0025C21386|nr:hypothetical protein [Clostridium sp. UBA4548]
MNYLDLEHYYYRIRKLPLKESYEKAEILTADFFIENQGSMEIYYCTHNEYVNTKAKIFIIGITPGFQQMSKSIAVARKAIERSIPLEEVPYICKSEGRFYGAIRKNIIDMLNELELNKVLGIESCSELFGSKDYLLHTTSVIPFAVFVDGKNYTGHRPKLLKNDLLLKYVKNYFYPQVKALKHGLFIPLGKSVEEVLEDLIKSGVLKEEQCLKGFPHPSGANGHRFTQFEQNKEKMKKIIKNYLQ